MAPRVSKRSVSSLVSTPEKRPAKATSTREAAPKKLFKADELSTGLGAKLRQQAMGGRATATRMSAVRIDGRSKADALAEMRGLLEGTPTNKDSGHGSTVVRDAPNVNSDAHWDYRTREYRQAQAQVAANGALEAEALA